jgi:hypothetical protein
MKMRSTNSLLLTARVKLTASIRAPYTADMTATKARAPQPLIRRVWAVLAAHVINVKEPPPCH